VKYPGFHREFFSFGLREMVQIENAKVSTLQIALATNDPECFQRQLKTIAVTSAATIDVVNAANVLLNIHAPPVSGGLRAWRNAIPWIQTRHRPVWAKRQRPVLANRLFRP